MQPYIASPAPETPIPEPRRRSCPGTGQKPVSILYFESNLEDWTRALNRLDQAGIAYDAELVETSEAFIAALESKSFGLVLSAYVLPGFDGPRALSLVRRRFPDLPFVFVTGLLGEEKAIEAMRMGATDYVLKQRLERLVPAVNRAIRESGERLERKLLKTAVRDTEDWLQIALETAELGSWQLDPATGALDCSARCKANLGLPPDAEFSYQSVLAAIHPEDRPGMRDSMERALRERSDFRAEYRVIWPDGSTHWILTSGRGIYGDDGSLSRMVGVTRNVTKQRQAEDALRASEEKYRLLANAFPQFIWVTDEWGNPEFLNQYWFDYTGQTLSDQLNGNWRSALHPGDIAATEAAWKAARETGGEAAFEYRVRRASDGTYRWFSGRSKAMLEDSGRKWAGSAFDITDRKDLEEHRERHASQLRSLFESGLFGVILSDASGSILEANDEFLKMAGYNREDLLAGRMRWRDMTPPEYLPLDETGIAECQERGACTPYEKEYVRKDGSRLPILIGYTRGDEGKNQYICFALDLTAREQLVKELGRSNEDLSRFAHVVSHDLQAPLRLIRTHTELLSRKFPDSIGADGREIMQTIAGSAAEMQDLIESLLRFAQTGPEAPESRPVAVSEVLDSVAATLRPQLEETGTTLECGPLPQMHSNPIQLRQLFQNLLTNAVKYRAPNRPPRIRITAQSCGGKIRFAVEDNGIGIQAPYHEQIFQPLKRLHGHEIPGTGMGLAVCKSIVERHGGRIWVESIPGEGSTFYFTLAS